MSAGRTAWPKRGATAAATPSAGEAAADHAAHARRFVERAVAQLSADDRIIGLLHHGSAAKGQLDAYSDLDITCIVRDDDLAAVVAEGPRLLATLGELLAWKPAPLPDGGQAVFCLFDPGFLRVEFVFSALDGIYKLKDPPLILWDGCGGRIGRAVEATRNEWPRLAPDDLETRFWLNLEQAVRRLGRGEYFDVLDMLAMLRHYFIGPMILRRAGLPPNGLRRIEQSVPFAMPLLRELVAGHDRADCGRALLAAIRIYEELRRDAPPEAPLDRVAARVREKLAALGFS